VTHELIGHKIVTGRIYAHIARVFDEGTLVLQPLVSGPNTGKHVGQFREQPICKGMSGRTWRHSSMTNSPEQVQRDHARMVEEDSNGFADLAQPPGYEPCEECSVLYLADQVKAALS